MGGGRKEFLSRLHKKIPSLDSCGVPSMAPSLKLFVQMSGALKTGFLLLPHSVRSKRRTIRRYYKLSAL